MDISNSYDMNLFRDKFKEIYNENKYNFPINDTKLNNNISLWKKSFNKFNKNSVLENEFDYEEKIISREYRLFYQYETKKNN